ncbi:hypothetical protein HNV12_07570 [Methanococcoides sp. SA1]|nr:hypothetical protein [Methanococcoides sp. SA1]
MNTIMEPIFVKGMKVLGPFNYDRLTANIEKDYLRDIFEVCFCSGVRYVEVQRLYGGHEGEKDYTSSEGSSEKGQMNTA